MACGSCNKRKGFFPKQESEEQPTVDQPLRSDGLVGPSPCRCEFDKDKGSIYCDRHKCTKTNSLWKLCQTRQDYFDLWEEGKGPMQDSFSKELMEQDKQNRKGSNSVNEEDDTSGFFMGDLDIPKKSRGLGDTVAKITKATGIKTAVDTVNKALGRDCGCKERQSKLNKIFPYQKPTKTKGFFE